MTSAPAAFLPESQLQAFLSWSVNLLILFKNIFNVSVQSGQPQKNIFQTNKVLVIAVAFLIYFKLTQKCATGTGREFKIKANQCRQNCWFVRVVQLHLMFIKHIKLWWHSVLYQYMFPILLQDIDFAFSRCIVVVISRFFVPCLTSHSLKSGVSESTPTPSHQGHFSLLVCWSSKSIFLLKKHQLTTMVQIMRVVIPCYPVYYGVKPLIQKSVLIIRNKVPFSAPYFQETLMD